MARGWRETVAVLGLGLVAAASAQTAVKKHAPPAEHGPHLEGAVVTLPLVLVKGYPFVEGAVNGKPGKLMFDIGDADSLAIDDHTVRAAGGIKIGSGNFGSGQTFDKFSYPIVSELTLPGGLRFRNMTNVPGNAGLPIEQHITPEFIGWLGVDFFSGYVAKLDYAKPAVTFYRDDASGAGELAALAGEKVVASIPFEFKQHKNLVYFRMKVGETEFLVTPDTGSHSTIWVSDAQLAALKAAGTFHEQGDEGGMLSGMVIDTLPLAPMRVDVAHGKAPMAKLLPATEAPLIVLGYEFLNRYRTVWDYDGGVLTLLEK